MCLCWLIARIDYQPRDSKEPLFVARPGPFALLPTIHPAHYEDGKKGLNMSIKTICAGLGMLVLIGGPAACGVAQTPAAAPVGRVTQTVAPNAASPAPTKTVTASPQIIINNNNNNNVAPTTRPVYVPVQPGPVTLDGCRSGYVCMYTVAGWQNQQPENEYFDYGYYNLSGEIGTRVIVNNQAGGATVTGYYNYGGTGWAWTLQDYQENEYDITPINSIGLDP